MLLALLISLAIWCLLAFSPLRGTRFAHVDNVITDQALRLGVDARVGDGTTLMLVEYDDKEWHADGEVYDTPAARLAQSLDFARQSGAMIAILDIELDRRTEATAHDATAATPIADALARWQKDRAAPLLVVADTSEQNPNPGAHPYRSRFAATPGNIVFGSVGIWHDANGISRDQLAWQCATGRPAVPSVLTYAWFAARERNPAAAARAAQQAVAGAPCDDRAVAHFDGATFRRYQPILFHLTGTVQPIDDRGRQPAFQRITTGDAATALATPPQVRGCDRRAQIYREPLCGGVVMIGATHAGAPDKFTTPISAAAEDRVNPDEANGDPRLPGSMVLGNAIRGMLVFGPARQPTLASGLLVICACIVLVYGLFELWRLPGKRLARWRKRSVARRKQRLARFDWVFGPIIAKIVATTATTLILILYLTYHPAYVGWTGVIVAYYSAAVTFAIRDGKEIIDAHRK